VIGVTVRLYATLRRYGPEGGRLPFRVEVEEGASVQSLLRRLGIPPKLSKLAFVNSVARADDFRLSDGDEVGLFPPIAGG
jgi:molybdopterin converting factor small subunit